MYITDVLTKTKKGNVSHRCILLRQSYRENGKVRTRTIANITHCKPAEIAALRLALGHKNDLGQLVHISDSVALREGQSVGAVWAAYKVAQRLGIEKALGTERQGKLALWQVLARVIEQGSRLSAVRLAQRHAACDTLGMRRGFDENDLYENLAWLAGRQSKIEWELFKFRYPDNTPELYLYDVTSSYLEGVCNALAAFGYNRDGKRGKMQIVIGLLCDGNGSPLSIEVFTGNTQDPKTVLAQIKKVAQRFGGRAVAFVGDRGMIKSTQIKNLNDEGFHYITAITKPQINKLLEENVLQMELFDKDLAEVTSPADGARYVIRRNPYRAEELRDTRSSKLSSLADAVKKANCYLAEHPRAKTDTAVSKLRKRVGALKVDAWVSVTAEGRVIALKINEEELAEKCKLDGCYVLKTDLPAETAEMKVVHDRYKDLALVEQAFRTSKTILLEMRPVFVHTEASTRAHALIVLLAYMIARELQQAWNDFDLTVGEGLLELSSLCSIEVSVKNQASCHRIPEPRSMSAQLLESLDVELPEALPWLNARVVTRKKLQGRRKKR